MLTNGRFLALQRGKGLSWRRSLPPPTAACRVR